MRGAEEPDQWVIRGNHHDAWVNGATDPVSGMVARARGGAGASASSAKQGFRPKRTLVFAAWDAEEPGLLGSVEWVERHADELREQGRRLRQLRQQRPRLPPAWAARTRCSGLMNQVARDVTDPARGVSVAERLRARTHRRRRRRGAAASACAREDLRLSALGSGSDYTPFLQHLGVASLNLRFGGEDHYGQYHSIYDSYRPLRALHGPRLRLRRRPSRRSAGARCCGWRRPSSCPSSSPRSPKPSRATWRRSTSSRTRCARRPTSTTGCSISGPSPWWRPPTRPASTRHARTRCPTSTWRRSRNASAPPAAPRRRAYDRALREAGPVRSRRGPSRRPTRFC